MRRRPLLFFFIMAYAFSWVILIPYVLSVWGVLKGDFTFLFVLNAFTGPALSGLMMTRITDGTAGVRRLLRRCIQPRAGWQWYAFVLLGIPALYLLGIALLPGALASFQGATVRTLVVYVVTFVITVFLGGPLGEEPGWRGFALPRLQARHGALWGTLILGLLWTGWHLPHFLTPVQRGGPGTGWAAFLTNFPIFLVLVMSLAIIFTWVFNHTGGSVFMAILLHASINSLGQVVPPLFPAPAVVDTDLSITIGIASAALLIVILTRGRLGYRAEQERQTASGGG
jgi:membrane protease YdiL (CAAX protease family)